MTPPTADPTPGLTNLTASVSGVLGWAGCVISEPAYVVDGQVYFTFTPTTGEPITGIYDCSGGSTYAEVNNIELQAGTTYTVHASCTATNGTYVLSDSSATITTEAAIKPALGAAWLEIPAEMNGTEAVMTSDSTSNLFTHTYSYDSNHSYTVCYDTSSMTTYWVAYPLGSEHTVEKSGYRTNDWSYVSEISTNCQANIISASYKSSASGGTNNYDRGHLLPSAARNKSEAMNDQTFYTVNIAPQNATFNQQTWNNMETDLRTLAQNGDYLYVVTGTVCPQLNDGNGSFTPEKTYDNSGKEIPVPRYFYTVALKVNNESNPTSASTIGFWCTNQAHNDSYINYAVSVDQIEQWTGLNFFVNLPDTIEESAEGNSSWTTFQNF